MFGSSEDIPKIAAVSYCMMSIQEQPGRLSGSSADHCYCYLSGLGQAWRSKLPPVHIHIS